MNEAETPSPESGSPSSNSLACGALLAAFRAGDASAGNSLLALHRPWLSLLARYETDTHWQGKFDHSDIVQQALLEALRALPQFAGGSEAEFHAWLRTILAHALARQVRRFRGTQKRSIDDEISLEKRLAESSMRLADLVADPGSSPSERAVRHEQELKLADVLNRLPEDYRQVILLRNIEGLSHREVARRMNRGEGAVRMLWVRALARLREEMGRE